MGRSDLLPQGGLKCLRSAGPEWAVDFSFPMPAGELSRHGGRAFDPSAAPQRSKVGGHKSEVRARGAWPRRNLSDWRSLSESIRGLRASQTRLEEHTSELQ